MLHRLRDARPRPPADPRKRAGRQLSVLMLATSVPVLVLSWSGLTHFAESVAGFAYPWSLLWPAMFEVAAVMLARAAQVFIMCDERDEAQVTELFAKGLVAVSVLVQMFARAVEVPWDPANGGQIVTNVVGVGAHAVAPLVIYGLWLIDHRAQRAVLAAVERDRLAAAEAEKAAATKRAAAEKAAERRAANRATKRTTGPAAKRAAGKATTTAQAAAAAPPADEPAQVAQVPAEVDEGAQDAAQGAPEAQESEPAPARAKRPAKRPAKRARPRRPDTPERPVVRVGEHVVDAKALEAVHAGNGH